MTRSNDRARDRAIRQYQKDHPGMSLSDARRAVQRAAEQEQSPMPRRLPAVPVPVPGQSLESWVDKVAAHYEIGRHQAMDALGLEPGGSAAGRLRELAVDMPERTVERLCAATGIDAEEARAMAAIPPGQKPAQTMPLDEVVEYFRKALEHARDQAQSEGLPPSSPWTLSFIEPQITQFGGAQALRKAAKSAARRLRISLRVTIYRPEGHPEQLITVNNQGPYKTVKREPQDTAPAAPFVLDPDAGPSETDCGCGRSYCLSGSAEEFGRSPWPEPVWHSIRPDTDLRTLPEEYRRGHDADPLFARLDHRSFEDNRNVLDLTPFFEDAEIGPLADVQVYATNVRGQYRGSSHGALCRYADTRDGGGYGPLPSERHEILKLAELVEILRPLHCDQPPMELEELLTGGLARSDEDLKHRWCIYCHGYSVRRFTAEQCAHYRAEYERWSQRLDAREAALRAEQTLNTACPHCSAASGRPCTDRAGQAVPPHEQRRVEADRIHGRWWATNPHV